MVNWFNNPSDADTILKFHLLATCKRTQDYCQFWFQWTEHGEQHVSVAATDREWGLWDDEWKEERGYTTLQNKTSEIKSWMNQEYKSNAVF